MTQSIQHITQTDTNYPKRLKDYLKTDTPETIWIRGNINLLPGRNTNLNGDLWALFCSSKCPGEIILKAHDLAQKFKETDTPTIGGYHSPIEKECLRVLLRGRTTDSSMPSTEHRKNAPTTGMERRISRRNDS